MIAPVDAPEEHGDTAHAGPRAVLRALDLLRAVAVRREGASLGDLVEELALPKASVQRLLRTLDHSRYLSNRAGTYTLGPRSFSLADLFDRARPPGDFPACARPVTEWLASETGETVMIGVLSEQATEVVYVDVIESRSPLRFTIRTGNRRPLFSVASGKAILAFATAEMQGRYIANTDFLRFTADTSTKAEMPAVLQATRTDAVVFDRAGIVEGASGIASPAFGRDGSAVCAVSVAGPSDRMGSQSPTHRRPGARGWRTHLAADRLDGQLST